MPLLHNKALTLIGVSLLVLQTLFFIHTSLVLHGPSELSSTTLPKDSCKNVMLGNEACATLDEATCDYRTDCFAHKGVPCAGTVGNPTFLGCTEVYSISFAKKMKMTPRLPDWTYGHSDMNHFCAFNEKEEVKQLYRFESVIPSGWRQTKCVQCGIHPEESSTARKDSGLSLVALVHKEFDSFNNSIHSWARSGLLEYADETILWINHKSPDQDPIEELARSFGLTIMSSEVNLGIGPAISNLILAAQNPLVIFLEKDWEVVEDNQFIVRELDYAKRLVLSHVNGSRADAVKLRSRRNPGYPNIMKSECIPPKYDMEELNDYAQYRFSSKWNTYRWWLPHLFCNLNHFLSDHSMLDEYPNRSWRCGQALCFDSAQCGWTNNPILFKKHWYLDTLYEISHREDNPTFEGGTYYSPEWVEPHWVIAELEGFFKHHEINEHD